MSIFSVCRLLCILFLAWGIVGCSEGELALRDAWISEAPPNAVAQAGYFAIDNGTDQPRMLVGAASVVFESIEIHRTLYDKGTGMARMVHEGQVEIAPRAALRFEPGGYHLMLIKPKKVLREGDRAPITLAFADGSRFEIEFVVRREGFRF